MLNTALRNGTIARTVTNLNRAEVFAADGTTVLLTYTIGWGAGAAGVQEVQATPISTNASAAGVATTARLFKNDDTPDEQITGLTVTATGGGGDLTIDNVNVSNGQEVNLTGLSLTVPAALA